MKRLSALLAILCLLIPAVALAVNTAPKLYLEAFGTEELPQSPAPSFVCQYESSKPGAISCYAPKASWTSLYLAVHIDNLGQTCPNPAGPACEEFGGYKALPFGVAVSGEPAAFTTMFACPGFALGPSLAGAPGAVVVAGLGLACMSSVYHPCYLGFVNNSRCVGATYFDIVPNADLGHYKLVNCSYTYDENTTVACRAQWGGHQNTTCVVLVPVQATTWGRLKGMFR